VAAVLCFVVFTGFDSIALLPGLSSIDVYVTRLGINDHYRSISRGVLDISDIAYFIFVTVLFNEGCQDIAAAQFFKEALMIIGAVALACVLLSLLNIRVDLTEDKRFTLAAPRKRSSVNLTGMFMSMFTLTERCRWPSRSCAGVRNSISMSSGSPPEKGFLLVHQSV